MGEPVREDLLLGVITVHFGHLVGVLSQVTSLLTDLSFLAKLRRDVHCS